MSLNSRKRSRGQNDTSRAKKQERSETESPVTIAMSSGVLFKEQQSRGPAFSFVKALQAVNSKLRKPESEELFKVILIDDGSSDSIRRVIKDHGLEELITVLSVSEDQLIQKLQENNTHLYLSDESRLKAQEAVNSGIAAAIMFTPKKIITPVCEDELHVVFDGDAVLFSKEKFRRAGLKGFLEHQKQNVENPMTEGPFKGFLEVLLKLQKKMNQVDQKSPIRTYLVTSRGAGCDGYRALNTLHRWGLELDEAVFLGGSKKGPTLERIRPHIFFDDQECHVEAASEVGTVACLVLSPRQQ